MILVAIPHACGGYTDAAAVILLHIFLLLLFSFLSRNMHEFKLERQDSLTLLCIHTWVKIKCLTRRSDVPLRKYAGAGGLCILHDWLIGISVCSLLDVEDSNHTGANYSTIQLYLQAQKFVSRYVCVIKKLKPHHVMFTQVSMMMTL